MADGIQFGVTWYLTAISYVGNFHIEITSDKSIHYFDSHLFPQFENCSDKT
jgi:hypothetical protein